MIGQCLSNKNENATVSKSKKFGHVFFWVSPCACRGSININTLAAPGAASTAVARAQQNGAGHEACWQQQQHASGAARKLTRAREIC